MQEKKGIGTINNDRPLIQGVVGRESGQIRLTVCDNTQQATIQPQVEKNTQEVFVSVYCDVRAGAQSQTGHTRILKMFDDTFSYL